MSIDRDLQELFLLRVLGVLLILVGFAMLARHVPQVDLPYRGTLERAYVHRHVRVHGHGTSQIRVDIHEITPPTAPSGATRSVDPRAPISQ